MGNSEESDQGKKTVEELVTRCLAGDISAFRSLMESQQRYAYAVAIRLLRDEENAKEIVQEAFIRVWKNLANYRKEMKFTTWLYKIVVNLCYDRIKMDKRKQNIFGYIGGLLSGSEVPGHGDLHKDLELKDLRDHILSEAKNLPPKEYLVFHLRDIQDFSIGEIAEIAGMSVGSVKTNLCYARRRIRLAVIQMQEGEQ